MGRSTSKHITQHNTLTWKMHWRRAVWDGHWRQVDYLLSCSCLHAGQAWVLGHNVKSPAHNTMQLYSWQAMSPQEVYSIPSSQPSFAWPSQLFSWCWLWAWHAFQAHIGQHQHSYRRRVRINEVSSHAAKRKKEKKTYTLYLVPSSFNTLSSILKKSPRPCWAFNKTSDRTAQRASP